ncbi:hypothetical protein SDRG_04987 [Saprolegnia diclina VS20]|uniref:Uncharacterized protein n=1 Tax=Saprolegnia diclina (strain VS20) TaxID=1156394 RepID=T0RXK3_SAPDV|nr:hypothetical protein SDRG_04987 [Saprolegnia diclina VS20]EQC37383.1 hypothetical protein SDRG_04987 [Saprolegnia diclina VS20]|eukprot:XP_008608903.1 hypothetical protein SDRG_04987 [Saprolegnia diclina VS20]
MGSTVSTIRTDTGVCAVATSSITASTCKGFWDGHSCSTNQPTFTSDDCANAGGKWTPLRPAGPMDFFVQGPPPPPTNQGPAHLRKVTKVPLRKAPKARSLKAPKALVAHPRKARRTPLLKGPKAPLRQAFGARPRKARRIPLLKAPKPPLRKAPKARSLKEHKVFGAHLRKETRVHLRKVPRAHLRKAPKARSLKERQASGAHPRKARRIPLLKAPKARLHKAPKALSLKEHKVFGAHLRKVPRAHLRKATRAHLLVETKAHLLKAFVARLRKAPKMQFLKALILLHCRQHIQGSQRPHHLASGRHMEQTPETGHAEPDEQVQAETTGVHVPRHWPATIDGWSIVQIDAEASQRPAQFETMRGVKLGTFLHVPVAPTVGAVTSTTSIQASTGVCQNLSAPPTIATTCTGTWNKLLGVCTLQQPTYTKVQCVIAGGYWVFNPSANKPSNGAACVCTSGSGCPSSGVCSACILNGVCTTTFVSAVDCLSFAPQTAWCGK